VPLGEHRWAAISLAACKALLWGQRIELLQGEKMANSERRGGCPWPPPCRTRPSALVACCRLLLSRRVLDENY